MLIIIIFFVTIICLCCSTVGGYVYLQSSKPAPALARAPAPARAQAQAPAQAQAQAQAPAPARDPDSDPDSDYDTTDAPVTTTPAPTTTLVPLATTPRIYNAPSGQNNQSLIYTTRVTVRDNPDGGFDVWINAPITINHDVSIPGRWGGQVTTTIDTNWNIIVRYTSSDGWINGNNDTVGRLKITTGLQAGSNVTEFKTAPNYQGYWKFAGNRDQDASAKNVNVSITQTNGSRKLTFRSKDDLVTINAEVRGYYYYGGFITDTMNINISDTLSFGLVDIAGAK